MRPLIRKEPKGVVLIISPFNYPVFLSLGPLVCTRKEASLYSVSKELFILQAGAIAAGNAVAIKPSESTPATTALMTELAGKYLDKDLVRFINGAVPETTRVSGTFFNDVIEFKSFTRSWNYNGITVSFSQQNIYISNLLS